MLPDLPGGIPSYAAVSSIALLVAVLYNYFRLEEIDLTFGAYALYCGVGAVCAILLAKTLFAISYLPTVGYTFHNFFYYFINGGIVFYGGLFGLVIGILLVSCILHKDGMRVLDYVAPSFPLFHSIARFACLLGGCCYGIPWCWGVRMVESPDIVRFPVQPAESICCLVIFFVLLMRANRGSSYAGSFKLYIFLYACCRFVLEFFRDDIDRGIWFLGLSTSQIISLLIIITVGIMLPFIRKKQMRRV